jgi:nicotinamidase/pyrazinamidase
MSSLSALVVIDVQYDFCEGGALAVKGASEIIDPINQMMPGFDTIVLSQDWHPKDHQSFAKNHVGKFAYDLIKMPYGPQILWPTHCVQGSRGANFHVDLNTDAAQMIVRKGFRPQVDSYSAFFENDRKTPTGLDGYLKSREISTLIIVGLALDFCVQFTALDARALGYDVIVEQSACRAIDLDGSLDQAIVAMKNAGVLLR